MTSAASTPLEQPAGATAAGQPVPPSADAARLERVLFEIKRVIVGQDRLVERMLVAVLARGHVLLEGVPGVAKTLAVETLATVVGGTFARLQFTPDLVPADIIGTRIYKAGQDAFDTELGPVFANFVLTDEINRAPAKVQSALLEVMAEKQVSIGGVTHPLPDPFLVLATQNPIESEGVYPLPEAQRDRFLMKVLVDYPSPEEEREIIYRMGSTPPVAETVLGPSDLVRMQRTTSQVFVHHALVDYVVRLVVATRAPREHGMDDVAAWVSYGASPRASLGLIAASRALALVRGRDYVLPQDVLDVTADVLRHRLVLSYDALADGVPADHVIKRILQTVPLPQVTPRQRAGGFGPSVPGGPAVPQLAPPQGQPQFAPGQPGPLFGPPQGQPVPQFGPGPGGGPVQAGPQGQAGPHAAPAPQGQPGGAPHGEPGPAGNGYARGSAPA
ncbi:AAA family ATPase [Geodermatophilus sp. SYSU D00742]